MQDPISLTIGVGVVTNFIYDGLKSVAGAAIKELAPGAFRGSALLLKEVDREFDDIKKGMLSKYSKIKTFEIFLSPEKTIRKGVLNPLFENIFLGKALSPGVLVASFRDCLAKGESITAGYIQGQSIREIIDDLIQTTQRVYLSNTRTAPFVVMSAVKEVQNAFQSVQELSLRSQPEPTPVDVGRDGEIFHFCKDYLDSTKSYVREIIINGLDAVTKKERVRHVLQEAYVPLTINHALLSTNDTDELSWRGNALKVITSAHRVIIRGPAGSGKTTLFQWFITNCNPFAPENDTEIREFPIYVPLRRLEGRQILDWGVKNIVYETLPSEELKRRFPSKIFDELKKLKVPYTFLLDGVDEIAESSRDSFWKFVENVVKSYPDAKVIITSRNLAVAHVANGEYRDEIFQTAEAYRAATLQWRPPIGFFEFVVLPLTNDEIAEFVDRWHSGVDEALLPSADRGEILTFPRKLKSELFMPENKAALELSRIPLLCSLICMVFFLRGGKLPKSRRGLYEISTKLLVETRDEHRGISVARKYSSFTGSRRIEVLRRIALLMQEGLDPNLNDQLIEIEKPSVISFIQRWREDNDFTVLGPEEIVNFLIERCSIIREPVANRIDFIHRSFMEYLAANEAVLQGSPYSLRSRIFSDQWLSTLQFCMDTETGGAFFAGNLISEMIKLLDERRRTTSWTSVRPYHLRIASLLGHTNDYPNAFRSDLEALAIRVLPPQSESEIEDCMGIPFAFLRAPLAFETVREKSGNDGIVLAGELLAKHADERCGEILRTGYESWPDRALIHIINRSGKLKIDDHSALIARVKNGSYGFRVFYTADELVGRSLIDLDAREVGIRFPLQGPKFVGWDHLYRCREVTIIDAHQSDWDKVLNSVNIRRFDGCSGLELENCFDFDFHLIAKLFPAVRYVIIDGCYYMRLDGIQHCEKLEMIEFRNIIHPIEVVSAPPKLGDIVFTNCGQAKIGKDLLNRGINVETRFGITPMGGEHRSRVAMMRKH